MSVSLSRRPFTVDEFHKMIETGVLSEDDRVELVDGEIVQMAAIGRRHAACVRKLLRAFQAAGDQVVLDIQNPLTISGQDELYPDVVLLKPREDLYERSLPTGSDTLLVVEVSDTTLDYDYRMKLPRYADAGVPEVWIVDLNGALVSVHRKPGQGRYQETVEIREGGFLESPQLPGLRIRLRDILASS